MTNIMGKGTENEEIKNFEEKGFFNNESRKKGLVDTQKKTNKEKEKQNKKIKQLKDLLTVKDDTKEEQSIVRIPKNALHLLQRKKVKINKLPSFDPNKKEDSFQIDGRCYDVSTVDIKNNLSTVKNASFDNQIKRPKDINDYFNPEKIMELGKNPGLNIKELHKRGITGKNIGIAIIDQTLLVKHKEYKDNLKLYDEIAANDEAQMHGAAVASIAVGKNTGVAPDANLYYIGLTPGTYKNNGEFEYDLRKFAKGINKIVETNKLLPDEKKIRVISISLCMDIGMPGGKEAVESIEKATKEGIYVIHTGDENFFGAGRNPESDPDNPSSYTKGFRWDNQNIPQYIIDNKILFPMDSRSVASPTGNNDYVFYRHGGWSWVVPYIAGVYALCCQVKPNINKDIFWEAVYETSTKVSLDNQDFKIINPVKLIKLLENKTETEKLKNIFLDNNKKNFQQFLVLNPKQFDQGTDGRRKITSEAEKMYFSGNKQQAFEIFNKQEKIIDYYIEKYPKERPERPSKELLRFHQVQLLAFQGKNEEAIKVIKGIHPKDIGISEIYYKATLAFFEHDKQTLQKCYAEKNDENHEFIKRFLDAIDINKTYLEAYGNI